MQLNWIPGLVIITIAIAGSLLIKAVRALRMWREWKYPTQYQIQAVEPADFPTSLGHRINDIFQELASLGYTAIGHCSAGLKLEDRRLYYSVWRRGEDVAEVCIQYSTTAPQLSVAIGREFTDGSSLAIDNAPAGIAKTDFGPCRHMHLENLWDIRILDSIARAWISQVKSDHSAVVPDNAVAYKQKDFDTTVNLMLASKNYVLDSESNSLRLTLAAALMGRFGVTSRPRERSFRLALNRALNPGSKWEVAQFLRQLGFDENYNPLPTRAFPVKLVNNQTAESIGQIQQTEAADISENRSK